MTDQRDDDLDEPTQLQRCVVAGCRRLARGLYCIAHLRALAALDDRDDEREPDPPPKAA